MTEPYDIRSALAEACMTANDLARLCGVHRGQVWRWKQGDGASTPGYARTIIGQQRRIAVLLRALAASCSSAA